LTIAIQGDHAADVQFRPGVLKNNNWVWNKKMAKSKDNQAGSFDFGAFFEVSLPTDQVYMHNVLLAFVHAIPDECYAYCKSAKHPIIQFAGLPSADQAFLRDYVEERLGKLADYEYRGWINGSQPFVTPRELQLWRLRIFVQYVWFWNLPDDDDLAMIFNLTKRQAANLAADFVARFRKTIIYPVALRRLYYLLNTAIPESERIKHPKSLALGNVYRIPSARFVNTAQYLVEDIRAQLPSKRMVNPFLWDKEQYRMWVDIETVDVVKTDTQLRDRLYSMYKVPEA
jgi:hypothetical protein